MATKPDIDTLLTRLRAFRVAAKLSYSALAIQAGLSRAALMAMDRKDWGPTSDTIRKLEALIPRDWQPGDTLPAPRSRLKSTNPHRDAA